MLILRWFYYLILSAIIINVKPQQKITSIFSALKQRCFKNITIIEVYRCEQSCKNYPQQISKPKVRVNPVNGKSKEQ